MKKKAAPQAGYCLVRCKVEPGMFRGEWLVSLRAIDPNSGNQKIDVQLFADERDVTGLAGTPKRNQPVAGLLRVSMAGRRGDFTPIILPQPSQPIGPNVCMHNDDLVDAA